MTEQWGPDLWARIERFTRDLDEAAFSAEGARLRLSLQGSATNAGEIMGELVDALESIASSNLPPELKAEAGDLAIALTEVMRSSYPGSL